MDEGDLNCLLGMVAPGGEGGEEAGGGGAEVGPEGEGVGALQGDQACTGQGRQGGGEDRAGLDEDGEDGADHHRQVPRQPAKASDWDVLVDAGLDCSTNLLPEKRVEELDHPHEAAAEHGQADHQQDGPGARVPDIRALRPEQLEQVAGAAPLAGLENCDV